MKTFYVIVTVLNTLTLMSIAGWLKSIYTELRKVRERREFPIRQYKPVGEN